MTLRKQFLMIPILIGIYFFQSFYPEQSTGLFISTSKTKFIKQGRMHFIFSANYWHAMYKAFTNKTELIQDLDLLQSFGVNNLRIMASSEGPDSDYRVRPALQPTPYTYNQDILDGLDYTLYELSKRDMSVVLVLNNYWHWSGGFAQYVSWITNTSIPYPSSWDPTRQEYTNASIDPFLEYSSRFYDDPTVSTTAMDMFKAHILVLINRVNKYTGVPYSQDPTILAWELANEPQFPSLDWVHQLGRLIKKNDQNHLVAVGLESRFDIKEFMNAHSDPTIDYCTVHIWAQNRGIYNMTDSSEENISGAIEWALGWVDKASDWALRLGKPLVLEEFGMPRDNFGDKKDWYSYKNPTTRRDRYFKSVLDRVVEKNFAGFGFWSFSGTSRPGDQYIGDPPHEPSGWYSVYDTDTSTLSVMSDAFQSARKTSWGECMK